ncbi:MAG: hypothetical protein KA153_00060 [Hyphomonadaceae bacterium]|jgi:predicted ATP-grasp superfamily ATP-dependent carboligase|nr:hypothetical protein [Hyphomonadaceae bacterium]
MAERVLITGARAPAALDLARSFAAAGFETHMADCVPGRMARWSRAVTQMHRYPAPRTDAAGFNAAVSALAVRLKPALIIPACEEVFHLAAVKPIEGLLFAPPLDALRRLHSKMMFADDCAALGLPAPKTSRVVSTADLDAFRASASEWVFKPEYSRFGTHALVGPDADAMRAVAPSAAAPWVVQRRVRGLEVSFYTATVNGRLAAFSAYRSTWRFSGGAGYAFEPLEARMAAQLREIAEIMARKLVPSGQFACDVMVDEAGTAWLLECNPRATSGVHMFGRSGELALAMLGRNETTVVGAMTAAHVGPALWWYGLPEAVRRGRWNEWRQAGADVIGAPGDRAPVLGALVDTVGFGARALASGKGLAEVMTADIEWNGEEL